MVTNGDFFVGKMIKKTIPNARDAGQDNFTGA